MPRRKDDRDTLREWLEENGLTITWLARETGWTREMLSYVVNKHRPLSRKLARVIHEKTGLKLKKTESDNKPALTA